MSSCADCDAERKVAGQDARLGRPCDICGGFGVDYLGRPCRHRCSEPVVPLSDELAEELANRESR